MSANLCCLAHQNSATKAAWPFSRPWGEKAFSSLSLAGGSLAEGLHANLHKLLGFLLSILHAAHSINKVLFQLLHLVFISFFKELFVALQHCLQGLLDSFLVLETLLAEVGALFNLFQGFFDIVDGAQQHDLGLGHLFQGFFKGKFFFAIFQRLVLCAFVLSLTLALALALTFFKAQGISLPKTFKGQGVQIFFKICTPFLLILSIHFILMAILPGGLILAHKTFFKVLGVHVLIDIPCVWALPPFDPATGTVQLELLLCPLCISLLLAEPFLSLFQAIFLGQSFADTAKDSLVFFSKERWKWPNPFPSCQGYQIPFSRTCSPPFSSGSGAGSKHCSSQQESCCYEEQGLLAPHRCSPQQQLGSSPSN